MALNLEHRDTRFLGNRSSSSFFHRCLVNWLLLRCQRQTSRVKEAFVGFGYQKPNPTPAHVALVKQSMLLRRVSKEPYLVQTERCGGETRCTTLALSGGPADLSLARAGSRMRARYEKFCSFSVSRIELLANYKQIYSPHESSRMHSGKAHPEWAFRAHVHKRDA